MHSWLFFIHVEPIALRRRWCRLWGAVVTNTETCSETRTCCSLSDLATCSLYIRGPKEVWRFSQGDKGRWGWAEQISVSISSSKSETEKVTEWKNGERGMCGEAVTYIRTSADQHHHQSRRASLPPPIIPAKRCCWSCAIKSTLYIKQWSQSHKLTQIDRDEETSEAAGLYKRSKMAFFVVNFNLRFLWSFVHLPVQEGQICFTSELCWLSRIFLYHEATVTYLFTLTALFSWCIIRNVGSCDFSFWLTHMVVNNTL